MLFGGRETQRGKGVDRRDESDWRIKVLKEEKWLKYSVQKVLQKFQNRNHSLRCSCVFPTHGQLAMVFDTEFEKKDIALIQFVLFRQNWNTEDVAMDKNLQKMVFIYTGHRDGIKMISNTLNGLLSCPKILKIVFDVRGDLSVLESAGYLCSGPWRDLQLNCMYAPRRRASLVNSVYHILKEVMKKSSFSKKDWKTCAKLTIEDLLYAAEDVIWTYYLFVAIKDIPHAICIPYVFRKQTEELSPNPIFYGQAETMNFGSVTNKKERVKV